MSIIEGSAIDPMAQAMWDQSAAGPVSASPLAAAAVAAAAAASGLPSMQAAASGIPSMQVDWKETAEGHVIKADLPGVRKEEVKVELERGGVLAISGERHREVDEQGDTWRQLERSSGKFTRRFQLPENAKVEGVKASMEHGVLTITVPKINLQIESARQMVAN